MSDAKLDIWNIPEQDFPKSRTLEEQLKFLLNYAVLAPSGHNTQPWLFKINDNNIELFADLKRSLPVADPFHRELIISCGAALFNLRAAIRYFGYRDIVEPFPDPNKLDFLARIAIDIKDSEINDENTVLFRAIKKRKTNRFQYENRIIPEETIRILQLNAQSEGAWFDVISINDRDKIINIVKQADIIWGADKEFRKELAEWMRPNYSSKKDGLFGYSYGVGNLASYLLPFIIKNLNWGKSQAKADAKLAESSPVIAVLGTDNDDKTDWLSVGQSLSKILLTATVKNLQVAYLNPAIELPELRNKITNVIGSSGYPQLLLRLGYSDKALKHTPRRDVSDILFSGFPE